MPKKYREGSLEAPERHVIDWENPDYVDPQSIDAELRRVFDVCHGCRRCFNLCDSFPRLFDLIDASPSGELDTVDSADFKSVVDGCTLCDMCFSNKCPYVPPHEFDIDFPHLMLRYRHYEHTTGKAPKIAGELAKVDRNAKLAGAVAPVANWAMEENNKLMRPLVEKVVGIHRKAAVPKFHPKTWVQQAKEQVFTPNKQAPAYGQKAVLFATCSCNYNNPHLGKAAQAILAHNGIETQVVYPACCGMPMLEQGNIEKVVRNAHLIAEQLLPWVEQGYGVIAMVPSCALMIKQEWPLLLPNDPVIKAVQQATQDVCQYLMNVHKKYGLVDGLQSLGQNVTVHISCHSRAQNMGQKAAEVLRLIPDTTVQVIERCSGHGGIWGMMVDNFEVALRIGKPVATQALAYGNSLVVSECPLAADHIRQGMENTMEKNGQDQGGADITTHHPLILLAKAYGLADGQL